MIISNITIKMAIISHFFFKNYLEVQERDLIELFDRIGQFSFGDLR